METDSQGRSGKSWISSFMIHVWPCDCLLDECLITQIYTKVEMTGKSRLEHSTGTASCSKEPERKIRDLFEPLVWILQYYWAGYFEQWWWKPFFFYCINQFERKVRKTWRIKKKRHKQTGALKIIIPGTVEKALKYLLAVL